MDIGFIVIYVISFVVGLTILYFLIKAAVRNGTVEAHDEIERLAKIRAESKERTLAARAKEAEARASESNGVPWELREDDH
jgi:hypothetical protein